MQKPDYSDGVTDLECSLHSSFADLYADFKRKGGYRKENTDFVLEIFGRVRDITAFNAKMLRADKLNGVKPNSSHD